MDLFTYLLGKKGQNTQRDLFSYLLGKGAGGSGTYVNFIGTSLNISNTLRARIKNITLKGATSQDGTPTPDTPIPIKVVTGEQNINVTTPNLLDLTLLREEKTVYGITIIPRKDGSVILNGTATQNAYVNLARINFGTTSFNSSTGGSTEYIASLGNNNLTMSYDGSNRYTYIFIAKNRTFSNEAIYPMTRLASITDDTFSPYYSKDYPLSLGTLELAKIENYQDYIYGTPNNWYKHEVIKKAAITNNTIINKISSTRYNIKDDIDYYFSGDNSQPGAISNYYTSRYASTNGSILSSSTYNAISVYDDRFESVDNFRTWAISNLIIYRILSTAREIQITDTTLIEQLNNLYNATSQDGTTYITCSSASDSNEIIVFSGDIKVTSVGLGNPLNTSLLSSNIQEETNINDIQEEPNVDDVNEIENIEQNEETIEEEVS